MSETDPGYSEQHAGNVGAHRVTVGMPTDEESINVPQTRAGAAENALKAEADRTEHERFDPEPLVRDDRTAAVEEREGEARSQGPQQVTAEARHGAGPGAGTAADVGRGAGAGHAREARPARHGGGEDDEEDQVRRRIEETRGQLGQTVAELAHKADVKHRAGEMAGSAKARAGEMAGAVSHKAGEVAGTVSHKAGEVAGTVSHKAGAMAGTVTGKVREVTPDQVKDVAGKVGERARRRPALVVLAAAGTVAVFVLRRAMRRTRRR
ncbi:DUF3618 domain-containing protein [Nonomuraea rhodomycinica]|uniref:DUF3618 domain-containing protein n=1 Tax=Nonomuraea rhodomycinica TaxID=1712872 RepID=A0A7Y6IY52_9ACTN|nr:DUF3618 domain-containing protein [Nonomuraea rhodomycinica]NUW46522.1 DUF3618 domain-containing protein [Nonomuraea rhodomycinica]